MPYGFGIQSPGGRQFTRPYRGIFGESSQLPQNNMPPLPPPPRRVPQDIELPPTDPNLTMPRFEDTADVQAPMPPSPPMSAQIPIPYNRPPIQLPDNPMGVLSPRQAEDRVPPQVPPQMVRPNRMMAPPIDEPIAPDNPDLARRDPFQIPAGVRNKLQPPPRTPTMIPGPQNPSGMPNLSGPVQGGMNVNIDEGNPNGPINPMSSVRARNVFGKTNPPTGFSNINFTPPSAVGKMKLLSPRDTEDTTTSQVSTDGGKSETAVGKYKDFLGTMPDESSPEFKHTKMDKFRAATAGILGGGFSGARKEYNNKFDKAMSDFKVKADLLKEGADVETRRENAESLTKNRDSLIISRQSRADATKWKQEHPDFKYFEIKGGTVMGVNPITGEKRDTGISTGTMTEEDKLALQQENDIAKIAATGGEARKTEGVRQAGREKITQMRIDNPNFRYIPVKGGNWMAVNSKDPSDITDTGVGTGIQTDEELAEERRLLKETPGAESKTVTELNAEGTQRTTTRKNNAPAKDIKLPSGKPTTSMVTMKDDAGKDWTIKPENVEAFKKANPKSYGGK